MFFNSKNILIKKLELSNDNSSGSDVESNSDDNATPSDNIKTVNFHIKYDHNVKLSSIISSIASLENITKVEEI